MSEQPPTNAERLEQESDTVDPTDILKQADKLSRASSDTVLKYIVMAILVLFGSLFFLQWRQNSSTPDRLIAILERSASDTQASLKVQESALAKIQEFSIRVPMEHASAERKIDDNAGLLRQMRTEQDELRAAIKANSDAVKENTEAVARLIKVIEAKLGPDPNAPMPPS